MNSSDWAKGTLYSLDAQAASARKEALAESASQPLAARISAKAREAAQAVLAMCSPASKPRRLRISETISLGEKRFVAIVQVDGKDFLIGGGAAGVSLLTLLAPEISQQHVFREALDEAAGKAGEV